MSYNSFVRKCKNAFGIMGILTVLAIGIPAIILSLALLFKIIEFVKLN